MEHNETLNDRLLDNKNDISHEIKNAIIIVIIVAVVIIFFVLLL
jgi:hypothetical protein